ncbi:MAG: hypothetical protein JXR48_09145 [Candidatus Delongbacteria bacterium]|nr:hypothetical protein [Candidatus Delongbacteria bacterium]MBN2835117.1 hypothetical protein [Candidatus Delongbacteria bacterium]
MSKKIIYGLNVKDNAKLEKVSRKIGYEYKPITSIIEIDIEVINDVEFIPDINLANVNDINSNWCLVVDSEEDRQKYIYKQPVLFNENEEELKDKILFVLSNVFVCFGDGE